MEMIGALLEIPGYVAGAWFLLCAIGFIIGGSIKLVLRGWWIWRHRTEIKAARKASLLRCTLISQGPTDEWRWAIERAGIPQGAEVPPGHPLAGVTPTVKVRK